MSIGITFPSPPPNIAFSNPHSNRASFITILSSRLVVRAVFLLSRLAVRAVFPCF
jgi:hypothetical protein